MYVCMYVCMFMYSYTHLIRSGIIGNYYNEERKKERTVNPELHSRSGCLTLEYDNYNDYVNDVNAWCMYTCMRGPMNSPRLEHTYVALQKFKIPFQFYPMMSLVKKKTRNRIFCSPSKEVYEEDEKQTMVKLKTLSISLTIMHVNRSAYSTPKR